MNRLIQRGQIMVLARVVDYDLDPEVLALGIERVKHVNMEVLRTLPRRLKGAVRNLEITFFKVGLALSEEQLAREYRSRFLVPDPFAQLVFNLEHPEFAQNYPNESEWNRDGSVASYLQFYSNHHWDVVVCNHMEHISGFNMWYPGVCAA